MTIEKKELPFAETITATYRDRIDRYLSVNTDFSRTDIKRLIEGHAIIANDTVVRKPNFIVQEGVQITITDIIRKETDVMPEDIPLDVIYEDEDIAIINKPSGMVVHPAPGHFNGTLANALLHHFRHLSRLNGLIRPGIVHRIDKDTSGLLVVAKNDEAHLILSEQLKAHKIKRVYYAWVEGVFEHQIMHIDLPIGRDPQNRQRMMVRQENAKSAVTHVYVERAMPSGHTLVRCELETGRTHQIRVHLAYIKHPIVGDPVYGRRVDDFGQRLHAAELHLNHPRTGATLIFKAPFPETFDILQEKTKMTPQ